MKNVHKKLETYPITDLNVLIAKRHIIMYKEQHDKKRLLAALMPESYLVKFNFMEY